MLVSFSEQISQNVFYRFRSMKIHRSLAFWFLHVTHVEMFSFSFFTYLFIAENRYKHEAMVDSEPVLFEILDTCPKVRRYRRNYVYVYICFTGFRMAYFICFSLDVMCFWVKKHFCVNL